ncbi:hypothetical protein D0X99_07125 [Algoriphagus lacus]|uniref:Uncharacterized protein n=1 Tax=Algoriphagus lacus TaxID=2056311 RepID=A0A418PV82_9BACT|nr:hypothetical protein [Algoriphagus lacus]RIW17487.1 hypothetical protein D0X99_07125 [Algoriphagus lacus]
MYRPIYTFQEVIQINDHDWEKAHFMIQFFQEKGLLRKEIRGPEDIIYHSSPKLHDYDLIYDRRFKVPDLEAEPMRVKRNRI